ncbi:unnamed protein product [Brassica oleracea var. botrytis]|uniref:(rape) hypothetical protein n=1 Tax=Brassica napus TaxID=3708 RepID=A0A816RR27_BRANA|nr:unnamed protein product [Brassica napus]
MTCYSQVILSLVTSTLLVGLYTRLISEAESADVVEKPPQRPYTGPPPIGYPTRDVMLGDPPAAAVETKSKGDGFWKGCCAAICCCCVLDACF